MAELVENGDIPMSMLNYQNKFIATFDIETLAQKVDKRQTAFLTTEAHLYVVSIGVSTNIPGSKDCFFCRQTSDPEDAHKLVRHFLSYLTALQKKQLGLLPKEITSAIQKLEEREQVFKEGAQEGRSYSQKHKLTQQLHFLRKFALLNVYGFNSGKIHLLNSNSL